MLDSNWESDPNWRRKCDILSEWITESKNTILYVGAGISTNANIPDYRGPDGIYTLAKQGIHPRRIDMGNVIPTKCHYIIKEFLRKGSFNHVLSQNCDGLFLRSGTPQKSLSEIHGNMYIEVCRKCSKQFVRKFDTTTKSSFEEHLTDRKCISCNEVLVDSIVHQGEVGDLVWPHNWKGTYRILDKADLIIVLGTSCNVLQGYKHLWPKGDELEDTKVVLINKTVTVKDRFVSMKISADCDDVMSRVAKKLNIKYSSYCRSCDPILGISPATDKDIMMCFRDCICSSPVSSSPKEEENVEEPGWWTFALKNIKVTSKPSSLLTKRKSARAAVQAIKKNTAVLKRKPPKKRPPPKDRSVKPLKDTKKSDTEEETAPNSPNVCIEASPCSSSVNISKEQNNFHDLLNQSANILICTDTASTSVACDFSSKLQKTSDNTNPVYTLPCESTVAHSVPEVYESSCTPKIILGEMLSTVHNECIADLSDASGTPPEVKDDDIELRSNSYIIVGENCGMV